VEGFCEHDNEPSGFIKGGEFLNELSDCQLLKKNSAMWSQNAVSCGTVVRRCLLHF